MYQDIMAKKGQNHAQKVELNETKLKKFFFGDKNLKKGGQRS
jgi:hypothetical protein